MSILTKIKNMIKAGKQTESVDSNRITVDVLGKKQAAFLIMPYGIEIDPPVNGIMHLLLSESGNEDSMFAFPVDIDRLIKAKIIIRDNNKMIFSIDDKNGGDFMARFNELKLGFDQLQTDFNNSLTHTHSFVGLPSGTPGFTGPPAPPITPSTASIDAAKIEEIEVPSV